MSSGSFQFDRFTLDPADRQLRRDDVPVELNGRYFDALTLLVTDAGKLISKNRFLEEVWRGVPVTDEALTQCVKTLRRQLGDDAANPIFIETVPKHGYRFIAPVDRIGSGQAPAAAGTAPATVGHDPWQQLLLVGGAGTLGGGFAGVIGGLFYGFAGASQPLQPGIGAVSVMLVLLCMTIAAALIGGAGVSFGIAATSFGSRSGWQWNLIGGALGGMIVGAVVKLLGLDAFNLLVGQSPGDITGAAEGAVLGGAVGLGAWLGSRRGSPWLLRRSVAAAAVCGGIAGILIALLGGRMMGGSLDLLARQFPNARFRLDQIGLLFGEEGFGPISHIITGALEGMLFGGCIVGAMILARRIFSPDDDSGQGNAFS